MWIAGQLEKFQTVQDDQLTINYCCTERRLFLPVENSSTMILKMFSVLRKGKPFRHESRLHKKV